MPDFFEQLFSNPLYLIIAIVLAGIVVAGLIKRLLKLIALLAVAGVVFVGYLLISGQQVPASPQEFTEAVSAKIDETKQSSRETLYEMVRNAGTDLLARMIDQGPFSDSESQVLNSEPADPARSPGSFR